MVELVWIPEGLRFFKRRLKVGASGYARYAGDAVVISEAILQDCWNKEYFQTSQGNFSQFYARDFGMCASSLISLGHLEQVRKTLRYALAKYQDAGRVTVCITPQGRPYDFPTIAPDSLAFLTKSMVSLRDKTINKQYHDFIQKEVYHLFDMAADSKTGLPKEGVHLTGMRDHAVRKASCYDTCMFGMLGDNLDKLGIENPFSKHDYPGILVERYWTGKHFLDDLSGYQGFTGDANLMPFYTGLIKDKARFTKVLKGFRDNALDSPFPLRYFNRKTKEHRMLWTEFLVPNWEMDTVWGHLGMLFLETLERYNKSALKGYLEKWKGVIERDQNFIEVHHPEGRPYKSLVYAADEGMLWSSIWLRLWNDHGKIHRNRRE